MRSVGQLTFVPSFFTKKGINTFFVVLLVCSVLFVNQILPLQWILFGVLEVLLFFVFSTRYTKSWASLTPALYQKKLFRLALGLRVVWVLFSFVYFTLMTGQPFEYEAADALGYHGEGVWLSGLLKDGKLDIYLAYIGNNYSDMGYPFYLGLLYYVFGDYVLIPRLIKAVLGAFTCLLIYKIGRNNFGEATGRIAGILAMLVPNLIYYCGLHVKETEMVFLMVSFIYLADTLLRARHYDLKIVLLAFLLGASLFFFRTVLAVSAIASVGVAVFLTSRKVTRGNKRIGLAVLILVAGGLIFSGKFSENINEYLGQSEKNIKRQMQKYATSVDANKFASYGSKAVFLPIILVAPFPTLVDTYQPNAMMLGGAMFTRNIYAFFVLIALYVLIKRKLWNQHVLLLSALFSYLFILASSGFALSERFHLPAVPFLLIFAAFGISKMNMKNRKYFIPYLLVISVIIIGWNWFKLAGRGLE